MIAIPILICVTAMFGFLGFSILVSVLCATGKEQWAAGCVIAIIGFYLCHWIDDAGLLAAISFAAAFLSLIVAVAAHFGGGETKACVFACFIGAFLGGENGVQGGGIPRPEGGWLLGILSACEFLCIGSWFLAAPALLMANSLFGLDVEMVRLDVVTSETFPYLALECGNWSDN